MNVVSHDPLKIHLPGPLHPYLQILTAGFYQEADALDCDFIFHNEFLQAASDVPGTLKDISRRHHASGKKVIVFLLDDYEGRYRFHDNIILLRTSARKSKLRPNEIVAPYLFELPATPFAPYPDGGEKPRVAYCGQTHKREKILGGFSKDPRIDCDFIIRDKFWGGSPHDQNLIRDFYENIRNSPFNISQRGSGNFSMRFYQVMASGRIPVLVDTDMDLPFSDQIDYRSILVFEKDVRRCIDRVYHLWDAGRLGPMQQACGAVHASYLSPAAYFKRLTPVLRARFLAARPARRSWSGFPWPAMFTPGPGKGNRLP